MKRLVSILAFVFTIGMASPAWSFGSFGVKGGTGLSILILEEDPPDSFVAPDITPAVLGVTWSLGLLVAEVEADLLYMRTTTSGGTPSVSKTVTNHIALPVIGKIQIPIIPGVSGIQLGTGLELRYNLDPAEVDGKVVGESVVTYVPVVLGVDFDVQLARATAEIRYEHQMTDMVKDDGTRVHQILFLLGGSL